MSDAIKIRGLTKSYNGKIVLNGLDLTVKTGTVFGFLRANGAGKSTTIECILGTKRFDSGKVFCWDKIPLTRFTLSLLILPDGSIILLSISTFFMSSSYNLWCQNGARSYKIILYGDTAFLVVCL